MPIINYVALATLVVGVAIPIAASAGTFTTLYTFTGNADGGTPYTPLIYQGGELYGTTPNNGSTYIGGNVFKVNVATGALEVIYAFEGGSDGNDPGAGVIYRDGMLYGTTEVGGGSGCVVAGHAYGCGTIYSIDLKTGTETVLYSFSQDQDASQANPGDLFYLAGTLYGTTSAEGASNHGSVFSFNPMNGAFTTLYSFVGEDGASPNPILLYKNGLLYGSATEGGKGCHHFNGCGVVFSIDPATGAETVLHAFGSPKGGTHPESNLIYHANSLIGDTFLGGNRQRFKRGEGISFSINAKTGAERVLDIFVTGKQNYSALTLVGDTVYVTLPSGGPNGYGELDQLDLKTGQQTALYQFTGGADGSDPVAPLIYHDGVLYGSTVLGGNFGCRGGVGVTCGTIFKFVP